MPRYQPVASFHQDARVPILAHLGRSNVVSIASLHPCTLRAHIRVHIHIHIRPGSFCHMHTRIIFILFDLSFSRENRLLENNILFCCARRNNRSDRLRGANIFISFLIYIVACLVQDRPRSSFARRIIRTAEVA